MNLFRLYHIKIFLNTVWQPRIEEIYYNFQKIEISIYINMTSFGSIFIAEKMLKVSRQHLHKKWANGSIFLIWKKKLSFQPYTGDQDLRIFSSLSILGFFLCTTIFFESSKKVFDSYSTPSLGGSKMSVDYGKGSIWIQCCRLLYMIGLGTSWVTFE